MSKKNPLVLLAKEAVENFIKENKVISPPKNFPNEFLNKKAGTFVTIEKQGELRGCVGTYLPTKENIAQEVIQNAIAAATQDYRFSPLKKEELPCLSYTVYILGKPISVRELKELDPRKYGIIVKSEPMNYFYPKIGLLLPGLEGVNTVEDQISIACQKAGINPLKEKFKVYKFKAKKYR